MIVNFHRFVFISLALTVFSPSLAAQSPPASDSSAQEAAPTEANPSVDKPVAERFVVRKHKRRRRGCDRSASSQYKRMRSRWQKVPRINAPRWRDGYRDLALYAVNLGIRVRVFPFLSDGTLDPEAVAEIEIAFADKHSKETHTIHPRLLKLLYRLAVQFDARQINLISGYRESADGTESHHGNGTAMDIMIPGVKLPALAKVARRLGHVGVGYYPVSGFVHVDVREKASYFWVDPSGPGKHSCIRQIMASAGFKFDSRWKPGDDEPVPQTDRDGIPLDSFPKNEETWLASQNASIQKND
ncbi:MAG: DUF882 domain-containing protein [Deltaproteobacteria bacterium]|nr:DUF882 domain-containing protein [Deltaproteobacteria bacterium]